MHYTPVKYTWKRRPSEIRGYHRTLYLNDDNGDYLRVDYHLKEKRVRLYLELAAEGGNPYYSVISNGKITAERSVSTGRAYGFAEKFENLAEIFSTIPNRDVLRLINRNYGIRPGLAEDRTREREKKLEERKKLKEETRRKYFQANANPYDKKKFAKPVFQINAELIDVFDFIIGILLSSVVFLYFRYSFIAGGIISAFFGVIIGFIDMFIRRRTPVIFKVLFFIFAGTSLYIYGYYLM